MDTARTGQQVTGTQATHTVAQWRQAIREQDEQQQNEQQQNQLMPATHHSQTVCVDVYQPTTLVEGRRAGGGSRNIQQILLANHQTSGVPANAQPEVAEDLLDLTDLTLTDSPQGGISTGSTVSTILPSSNTANDLVDVRTTIDGEGLGHHPTPHVLAPSGVFPLMASARPSEKSGDGTEQLVSAVAEQQGRDQEKRKEKEQGDEEVELLIEL
jgi:hypothetical protein